MLLSIEDFELLGEASIDLLGEPVGVEDIDLPVSATSPPARARLMHLLDTNVVSELRRVRSGKADRNGLPGRRRSQLRSCSSR